jgi:hypothetical protein
MREQAQYENEWRKSVARANLSWVQAIPVLLDIRQQLVDSNTQTIREAQWVKLCSQIQGRFQITNQTSEAAAQPTTLTEAEKTHLRVQSFSRVANPYQCTTYGQWRSLRDTSRARLDGMQDAIKEGYQDRNIPLPRYTNQNADYTLTKG